MNKRQRKKRDNKGLILIFRCKALYRQEDYAKMEQTIKAQLNKGNLIVLPPQLTLEGIAGGSRVNKIKITRYATAVVAGTRSLQRQRSGARRT